MFHLHLTLNEFKFSNSIYKKLYQIKFIPKIMDEKVEEQLIHEEIVYNDLSFNKDDINFFISATKERLEENNIKYINNLVEPKYDFTNKIPYVINHQTKQKILIVADENDIEPLCNMLYDLAENEERNKKISTYHKGRKKSENHKQKMKDNHMGFIGKHHNEEFKQKQKENNTGEKNPMYGQGEKLKGENNGMYKKTIYDVWLEKYGKEEANIRYVNWKNSISNGIKRKKKVEVV